MAPSRQFMGALLAGALMLGNAAAQAETRIETEAFAMAYTAGAASGDILMVSATPLAYRISMESIGADLSSGTPSASLDAYDEHGIRDIQTASTHGRFTIDVADGYRVTGLSWRAYLYGGLETASYGGQTGMSGIHLDMAWSANGIPVGAIDYTDPDGVYLVSFSTPAGVSYDDNITLDFSGNASATAQGIGTLPDGSVVNVWSGASIGLYSLELTVNVSPVPEPGTWAMLLAGLAVAGVAARRRRR